MPKQYYKTENRQPEWDEEVMVCEDYGSEWEFATKAHFNKLGWWFKRRGEEVYIKPIFWRHKIKNSSKTPQPCT